MPFIYKKSQRRGGQLNISQNIYIAHCTKNQNGGQKSLSGYSIQQKKQSSQGAAWTNDNMDDRTLAALCGDLVFSCNNRLNVSVQTKALMTCRLWQFEYEVSWFLGIA